MIIFLGMYVFSLIGFLIHYYIDPPNLRTKPRVIELLLLYQIVFSIGMTSLLAFIGLITMPEYIAKYVGWPSSPFQIELGNVNLAFGILGILSIWFRGYFWTATVIGFSIWIFADGIHHIVEIFLHRNYSSGNIGIPLITDLAIPIIASILLVLYHRYPKFSS